MSRLPEEQFPPWDATHREANDPNPTRWVLNLRCCLLSLLRIHRPDCGHYHARETSGAEMRKRLEELPCRDVGSFVEQAQRAVAREVKLPSGYYVEWSGQYENQLSAPPLDAGDSRRIARDLGPAL